MVKKKAATRKKTAPPATRKTATTRRAKTASKKKAARRETSPKRSARAAVARRRVQSKSLALGRARVAGTGELDQYFLKDYEARQVFLFMGVKTLKELEQFTPQEIIDRLMAPMLQTVSRIRKALATQNRCLAGDQKFAVDFKRQMQAVSGK